MGRVNVARRAKVRDGLMVPNQTGVSFSEGGGQVSSSGNQMVRPF